MVDTLQLADRKDRDIQRYKQDIIDAKKALNRFLNLIVKKKSTVGFNRKEFDELNKPISEFINSFKKAFKYEDSGNFKNEVIKFEANSIPLIKDFKVSFNKLKDVQ